MSNLPETAKALLNNEAFVAALESAKQWHLEKAMACSPSNDLGRRHHLGLAKDIVGIANHIAALAAAAKSGEEVEPEDYYAKQARERRSLLGVFTGSNT